MPLLTLKAAPAGFLTIYTHLRAWSLAPYRTAFYRRGGACPIDSDLIKFNVWHNKHMASRKHDPELISGLEPHLKDILSHEPSNTRGQPRIRIWSSSQPAASSLGKTYWRQVSASVMFLEKYLIQIQPTHHTSKFLALVGDFDPLLGLYT